MSNVIIGLKMPNGLLISAEVEGKTVEHKLKGWNQTQIIGGHGITHEVPKALWDAYREQNKNSKLVRNGLIFAHGKESDVKSEAEEKKGTQSKLERLAQTKDKAAPGKIGKID